MSIRVEQFEAKLTDLTPTSNNPRQINQKDFEKLKKSLKEFPEMKEIREVVIDENNRILGGHMRVRALKELGEKTVFVKQVFGLTEEQKNEFVIKDNIANGEWDMDELANSWSDLPLDEWGIGIEWNTSEQEVVEDEAPKVDENEPADSELGVVYQLGRHRLMCGDSTDAGSVAILMDGQKADMVFTDPPYNVAIGDKNKAINSLIGSKSIERNLEGDTFKTDEEAGEKLWFPAFENMLKNSNENCSIYVTMPQGGTHMMMMMMMDKAGWQVKHELVWVKNSPTFSMGRLDYDYQHEPICFGWNKGHKKVGKGRFTKSIWQIDKPRKAGDHPTMKPIELVANALENSSESNDNILDVFGGSGSTLIACEQLGRNCYMMELDPKYCDVIRKRYWKFVTGSEEGWQEGTKEAK